MDLSSIRSLLWRRKFEELNSNAWNARSVLHQCKEALSYLQALREAQNHAVTKSAMSSEMIDGAAHLAAMLEAFLVLPPPLVLVPLALVPLALLPVAALVPLA